MRHHMTRQHCLLVFSRFSMCVYKKCKNIYIFLFVCSENNLLLLLWSSTNIYLARTGMWNICLVKLEHASILRIQNLKTNLDNLFAIFARKILSNVRGGWMCIRFFSILNLLLNFILKIISVTFSYFNYCFSVIDFLQHVCFTEEHFVHRISNWVGWNFTYNRHHRSYSLNLYCVILNCCCRWRTRRNRMVNWTMR